MITITIRVVCQDRILIAVVPREDNAGKWEQLMLTFFMEALRTAVRCLAERVPQHTEMIAPAHLAAETMSKFPSGGLGAVVTFGNGLYLCGRPAVEGNPTEAYAWRALKLALDLVSDFFSAGEFGPSAESDLEKIRAELKRKLADFAGA